MRSTALFAVAAALLLVGCQAQRANPASPNESVAPPEAAATPKLAAVASLEGEWRVAGIDGQPLDQPVGLSLSASKDEIWWAPRCAGFVRSYAIEGNRFAARPAHGSPAPKAGQPAPVICMIAPPPRTGDMFRAIDTADNVGRTPQNGVLISGGGHSLLLFSQ